MHRLRILTVNIHKGFSWGNRRFMLHQLRDAIRSTEADIVFLQEVVGANTTSARRHADWPDRAQHEFLADAAWPYSAYGGNAFYPHGHHGNAILSKLPILHSEQVDTSTNGFEQRGFLYCALDTGWDTGTLHCFCIHLGLFAGSRRKQLSMQAAYINPRVPTHASMIMAGDSNDWSGQGLDEFARLLGMRDAAMEANGKLARTFPARMPVLPLDRIYIRGLTARKSITHSRGVWKALSDHAALLVESELP